MLAKNMASMLKDIVAELEANPEKEVNLIIWDEQDNWEAIALNLNKFDSCFDLEMMLAEPYIVVKEEDYDNRKN